MSEIKPQVWIDPEYLPSLRHECTGTILRLNKGSSETTPLYTADQLAEAVAAERENTLRKHNISREDDLFWFLDDREVGHDSPSELLQFVNDFEIVHVATAKNTGEMFGFSSDDGNEDHWFKTEEEAQASAEAIRSAAK